VLGLPASPGPIGTALLVLGLLAAAIAAVVIWRRTRLALIETAVLACAAVTLGAGPYLVWRIVEDVRYTSGLDDFTLEGIGPIQAYLQPYLLDRAATLLPARATYATAVGDAVPYPTARRAFPQLALTRLFPRVSVADPRQADWLLAWGVDPRSVVSVSKVLVARPAAGVYPALYVAKVRR